MSVAVDYHWHLRRVMAAHDMFQTSELVPRLAERGVRLSREQVYRLVTGVPQRLSLHTLAALCDIFDCGPGDLIEPCRTRGQSRRASANDPPPQPRRARVGPAPDQA